MIKARRSVREIEEYVAGKSVEEVAASCGVDERSVIKLASNENCLGPSPKAVEAIKDAAGCAHLYPSVDAVGLREAIAARYAVPVGRVVCGAGMDGVLETLLRAFLDRGDEAVIPLPAFSYYEIVTRFCGARSVFCDRKADFGLDVDAVLDRVGGRTKFIFITSPNNPTGNLTPLEDIRAIADAVDAIVFVDEAYIDFAGRAETALGLIGPCDNVVVGRTMSKAWGLAGLRIGYAFVPEPVFGEYMKVATPFALSRIAIAAALGALGDEGHYRRSVDVVREERKFLLANLPFRAFPSDANFVLMDTSPLTSQRVVDGCMRRGVILRDCASFRGMGDHYVRVSIGTHDQNLRLIEALRSVRETA